jgi:cyanophycinase
VLPDGAQFDLTSRTLVPAPTAIVDPVEAAELAEAHQDLRQLARDIAAADASPTALKRRLARTRKKSATPTPTQDGVS